jgi:hypothetical protein
MKSWTKPTPELVKRAIAGMPYLEQQRYFFERLDNPEWIEALRKAKFFSTLPTETHEGNVVTFYRWPASRYLSRMAGLKPDLVAEIMSEFPETGNPFVMEDLLVAARAMPAPAAAKLAESLARSARVNGHIGMDSAGEVAANLAEAGEAKAALTVLRSVLDVVPDPRPVTTSPSGHVYRHDARTAIRGFDYARILRQSGERLAHSLGVDYLSLLSKKLVFALAQEYPQHKELQRPVEDYSYIWRAHLDGWDMHEGAKYLLISGVLQATETLIADGRWPEAQKMLEKQSFAVFERIQLFLLAKHPELDIELAAKKLADATLFHAFGLRQEYNQLARTAFPNLSAQQQRDILALIDAGLKRERMVERGLSDQEIEQTIRQWTLERYEPIRQSLPRDRQEHVEALEREFGAARRYENPVARGGAMALGGKSPTDSADLQAMSVDEVLNYLRTWSPDRSQPFGPTYQGLARELTAAIDASPERYVERLEDFKALPSTYLRAALQGFREATKRDVTLAWPALLGLAEWICEQPAVVTQQSRDDDWHGHDGDWIPSRFAIVDMLEDAIKKGALPVELDPLAWKIIDSLSDDESECLSFEEPGSLEKDVWSYSLNTLRPRAVRLALNFVEQCFSRLKTEGKTIDDLPDILAYLDKHLHPANEKCLSVRLIYGEKFPFLHAVAPQWASRAYEEIFPLEAELQPLRDVAWGAYLAANPAYSDLFPLLESRYRDAIQISDAARQQGKSHITDQPSAMLAHHLIQLFWRGKIDLGKDSPLIAFLQSADSAALRSLIIYVGQSLAETSDAVAPEVVANLQALWDHMLESDLAKDLSEIFAYFGWWFNTAYFEDHWALDHLEQSLKLARGKFEPLLDALARLARLAETYPALSVNCTRIIALAADEYVDLWTTDLDHILRTALTSGDAKASVSAAELINELGRRGHHSYRALIQGKEPSQ